MDATNFANVEVENGPVKGLRTKTVLGTDYISFRGIPYMKAPLGKLRFREAQTPRDWTDTFDATQEGPSYCMTDFMTNKQDGQENAGTINVYTKNINPEKLYPVMIWVHGGGFCRGSSRTDLYGPDYLLQKDVIVVSFNYRLGAIGFLSLDDPKLEIPGNVGLKDQVVALKWVKANIQKFGGDPKRCTIFGESAGGASVHYLTITEQTKGLFERAIIMSGSAFNKTWAVIPRNNQAQRLARNLGWKGKPGDERSVLDFLENVPAFELDTAANVMLNDEEMYGYGMLLPFGPCIEPYITDNCFISKEPIEAAREAWTNNSDIIVTGTSFEGLLRAWLCEDKAANYLQNPSCFLPLLDLDLNPMDPKAVELGKRIKQLYYKDGKEPAVENQEEFLRLSSDLHFWFDLYRIVQSRSNFASGKTYLMRFDVDAELNMFKALKKCTMYKGASHADDIFYLFATNFHAPPAIDSKEFATIQKMVGMFTSFAISGDPNCEEVAHVAIKPNDGLTPLKCVNITENDVAVIPLPDEEKFKIWSSIYEELDVKLY